MKPNITNTEVNIKSLIDLSRKEEIWLPEFQRPFVWDKNQVRLLIDSLYRGYTISSILIWKGGDELARRAVGARVKDIKIPEDRPEDVVYLLDGQQRTTALTLAFTKKPIFKGNNSKKKEKLNLYWDSHYTGDDAELKWVFDDERIENEENPQEPFMLKELSEEELFKKFNTRFVKIKHAFHFESKIVEDWFNKDNAEERAKMFQFQYEYSQKLKELENTVLSRKVYDIEQKGSLEQVLEVFERINTKNTKLSIFDIMVAKTYRKFDQGFFDLRSYYKIIKFNGRVDKDYFVNIEALDLDTVTLPVEDSDMLQLSMIILNKKFKGSEILKLNTEQLMQNTKLLHDKFTKVIQYMDQNFNVEVTELRRYNPILKFLAGAISHFDTIDVKQNEFLKSYFWNTLLKNRYPGAQSERIAKDYDLLVDDRTTLPQKLKRMINDNTRNLTYLENNSIDNLNLFDAHYSNRSQQIYRGMLLLLKSKNAKDFYNGFTPLKDVTNENKLEEHHIFPKKSELGKNISSKYEKHKYDDIINNIANIALITNETNNKRISSRLPSDYITDFENQYIEANKYDEFLEIMDSQFISKEMIEMLKKDQFEEFMIARTTLLYQQIEELCSIKN
ncbi:DUF262 domain-containing protein [Aequorivita vladivostokensis]|uniref:GmrSD restriction endonucleases N-terminal domain-containing protein n=1 Tax=Aequorivita vladivostokensis TaxID=171194 RepID=A0ABR5DM86_9FLAO|nr:DUF262 domain-containing protein [Aequorivita vladivostokensis]KJJ39873.1 hypothetical protein MB09_01505 [Aequorivita vladivostokensis]